MNNCVADQPKQRHTGGRPLKDIRSRLKGKEGRVRGNIMGKRVDFSARTVITPDPILQLDQLGVPLAIAMNLTVPEHVTRENMTVMKQLVANGPSKWPGAKHIIRHDGMQIDLGNPQHHADAQLDPGYIVER
jgi:DNA-directed RNA polymerase beta' subunit